MKHINLIIIKVNTNHARYCRKGYAGGGACYMRQTVIGSSVDELKGAHRLHSFASGFDVVC